MHCFLDGFGFPFEAGDMGSFADSGDMGTPSEEPLYLVTLVMLLEGAERIECKRGG